MAYKDKDYRAKYRKANRETINAKRRQWRVTNRETLKAKRKQYYAANRDKISTYYKEYRRNNPCNSLLKSARRRECNNVTVQLFELQAQWKATKGVCPIRNVPFVVGGNGRYGAGPNPNSPTLDRIDPSKGYVPGNVVIVSYTANSVKRNLTITELGHVVDQYRLLERNMRYTKLKKTDA